MTPTELSEQAMRNLILARLKGNARNINYWLTRLDYWTLRVIDEERKGIKNV